MSQIGNQQLLCHHCQTLQTGQTLEVPPTAHLKSLPIIKIFLLSLNSLHDGFFVNLLTSCGTIAMK